LKENYAHWGALVISSRPHADPFKLVTIVSGFAAATIPAVRLLCAITRGVGSSCRGALNHFGDPLRLALQRHFAGFSC